MGAKSGPVLELISFISASGWSMAVSSLKVLDCQLTFVLEKSKILHFATLLQNKLQKNERCEEINLEIKMRQLAGGEIGE